MRLEPTMFREYDIRGRESDNELNAVTMRYIGRGYGTFLKRRGIEQTVVGRDSRTTSTEFEAAFIDGLVSTGCDVVGIGLSTTPMLYWAQFHFETLGGAAVTASHNPAGWNGVKLAVGYSKTTNPDDLREIYQIIESKDFINGKGEVTKTPIDDEYVADLVKRVKINGRPKVLLNTGNGTAGVIGPHLLKAAGCEVVELHTELDATFPHYPANPSVVEMMEDTGAHVLSYQCDIGIAVDADGDRLGVTDEKGKTLMPDQYMLLLTREMLKDDPGGKIVFDVKCSDILEEDIRAHGGVPILCKTGHSYIKEKIHSEKADMGIELSGHIFIVHGYYGYDDALFTALKLIEVLSQQNILLSDFVKTLPKRFSSHVWNVHCDDKEKYEISDQITQIFKGRGYNVIDVSGARVVFEDGWGLIRASSNLPELVIRFEAKTEKRFHEIEQLFRDVLKEFPSVGAEWKTG